MISAIDTEKVFDEIQSFPIRALKRLGIRGTDLNIVRVVYGKSIVDIIQLG